MFRRLALNKLNAFHRRLRMHLAKNGPQTPSITKQHVRKPPDGQHGVAAAMAAI